MNVNNLFCNERKRKLGDEDETSKKNSKEKNEDIKPNMDMIFKNIKREPDFMMRTVKKEVDFVVREIKKEPCLSDTEAVPVNETESPSVIRRKKGKGTKSGKAGRKPRKTSYRKTNVKIKRRTSKICKKSTQMKKNKNCKRTRKTKTRKKSGTKNRRVGRSTIGGSRKKEASTLLDRQSSAKLRLFGFRDELEYFPSVSDHNEFEGTGSKSGTAGKRTVLSSLDARRKVLLALKLTPLNPSLKPKPFIQPHEGDKVDLLGSILESQSLWHSKNSRVKVKEDGSVEVVDGSSKKKLETRLTRDKDDVSAEKRKTKERNSKEAEDNRSAQPVLQTSLNLNENLHSHFTKIKIKSEACDPEEVWSSATVVDEDIEGKIGIQVKSEEKEERKDDHPSIGASPISAPHKPSSSPLLQWNSSNSPKNAKSSDDDDETDECPIFSIYSAASKTFSRERNKERQRRLTARESKT